LNLMGNSILPPFCILGKELVGLAPRFLNIGTLSLGAGADAKRGVCPRYNAPGCIRQRANPHWSHEMRNFRSSPL